MRIIIGTENITDNDNIVLMLDRIKAIDNSIQQMYLAFTKEEVDVIDQLCLWSASADENLHNRMMEMFFERKWDTMQVLLIALQGNQITSSFCGKLHNFYQSIEQRCILYKNNPPPEDWQGIFWDPRNPAK